MADQGSKFLVDDSFVKLSPKERANSIARGEMPDDWDYENIKTAIKVFEKRYPGMLQQMFKEMEQTVEMSNIDYHANLADKKAQGDMLRLFSLPYQLQHFMETAYPTIAFGANQ